MPIQTATQGIVNETGGVSQPFMFRNRIQNGEISVNQRGNANTTNSASNFHSSFSIDRWQSYHYNIGGSFNPNLSIKQTADHPIKGSSGYCLEVQCNTTGTIANNVDFFTMTQSIEAQNIADVFSGMNAQPMRLSFWVKSNKTGTYCIQLRDNSGSGSYIFIAEYNIIQSGTWEKKIISIPRPTHSGMSTNNTNGLTVHFHYASGISPTYEGVIANAINSWYSYGSTGVATNNQTNLFTSAGNYHRLTDVQLETGTSDTPFERRPYGTELALCQRYLPAIVSGTSNADVYIGQNYSSTQGVISIPFPVTTRTAPTGITLVGTISNWSVLNAAGGATNLTALTFNRAGTYSGGLTFTIGSAAQTAGHATWFICSSAGGAILFTGCEL